MMHRTSRRLSACIRLVPTAFAIAAGAFIVPMAVLPTPASAVESVPAGPVITFNGKLDIAFTPCSSREFPPQWTQELSFVQRPAAICMKWYDKPTVTSATWQIRKFVSGQPAPVVASGAVPSSAFSSASSTFQIGLLQGLPEYNETGAQQKYFVDIVSTAAGSTASKRSTTTTLLHQPKPPPVDAYSCAPDSYARKVTLEIPQMVPHNLTTTSGDDDLRDEVYVKVKRRMQYADSTTKKLSDKYLPNKDNYYQAFEGDLSDQDSHIPWDSWTDRDEAIVHGPVLYSGTMTNGQSLLVAATVMEQDNSNLQDIGDALQTVMQGIAAITAPFGGAGLIVAGVAEGVSAGTGMIPNTSHHDALGLFAVQVTNRCGHIQTAWVTFSDADTPEGSVHNSFNAAHSFESVESRLSVIDPPASGFPDPGVTYDWGVFEHVYGEDTVFWDAQGTSDSDYSFVLRAKVR